VADSRTGLTNRSPQAVMNHRSAMPNCGAPEAQALELREQLEGLDHGAHIQRRAWGTPLAEDRVGSDAELHGMSLGFKGRMLHLPIRSTQMYPSRSPNRAGCFERSATRMP
jgi:hypothetical protein